MRALVFEGPRQLRMTDVPDPRLGDDEVLIRVRASGICGSDLHGYLGTSGRRIPPMIMGHEFTGEVGAVGTGVKNVRIGERVTVQPLIFCGTCPQCRQGHTSQCPRRTMFGVMELNGSMTEWIAVPERLIYSLPTSVDDVHGALLEPLAVAYSAVRRADNVEAARHALVVGAGTIGLLTVQVLRALQPEMRIYVTDINPHRLVTARLMGADRTFTAQVDDIQRGLLDETGGAGVDLALEAVGSSATVQQALSSLRHGGTCIWVGNAAQMIELDMRDVVMRELEMRGSYAYSHAAFGEALDILAAGQLKLDPLISLVGRLEDGPVLFEKLVNGTDNLLKVILLS